MMNGVKTVEDVYRDRADVDKALDAVADTICPDDYEKISEMLSGAVIENCSFFYEGAEDKHPAAVRLTCITPDGNMCFLEFGHDSFIDQDFIMRFHDPHIKMKQIWESEAGYYSLIGQTGGETNEEHEEI